MVLPNGFHQHLHIVGTEYHDFQMSLINELRTPTTLERFDIELQKLDFEDDSDSDHEHHQDDHKFNQSYTVFQFHWNIFLECLPCILVLAISGAGVLWLLNKVNEYNDGRASDTKNWRMLDENSKDFSGLNVLGGSRR